MQIHQSAEPAPGNWSRVVLWRRIEDDEGLEHATFSQRPHGFMSKGTILCAHDSKPLLLQYEASWDRAWRPVSCVIGQTFGGASRTCAVRTEGHRWFVDGIHRPDLEHCDDIDLNLTPSTNTSAIRREKLAIGSTAKLTVAYISFPQMVVTTDVQSYERTSEHRYVFRSITTDFSATVDVDEDGLVVLYHGIWKRIAYETGTWII